jgi:hypothetical protein
MTMMVTEVYDALLEAGASPTKAKSAAEAIATYEKRFARIDSRLAVLQWVTGATFAGTVAILLKEFLK